MGSQPALAVQTVFAGLAPGMVGIYQLDLRLPEHFTANRGVLRCRSAEAITGAALPLDLQFGG